MSKVRIYRDKAPVREVAYSNEIQFQRRSGNTVYIGTQESHALVHLADFRVMLKALQEMADGMGQ